MQSRRFYSKKLVIGGWIVASLGGDPGVAISAAPGFDCEKAIKFVEKLICRDAELSQADQKMAQLYAAAIKKLPPSRAAELRSQQQGWLKTRNDCETFTEPRRNCVSYAYQQRISYVDALATGTSKVEAERSPPTLEELKNTTYKGLADIKDRVSLVNGKWEGRLIAKGSPVRPRVELLELLRVTGDMDGDGVEESVVLLNLSTGGTGQLLHIAVVGRRSGRVENLATRPIGDRVQIRDVRIQDKRLFADVVQAGAQDAMCCPGKVVTRVWTLANDGTLTAVVPSEKPSRLTLETIGGVEWMLKSWDIGDPVPQGARVTLAYKDGRFAGAGGCNQYFAPVKDGDAPGEVIVGPIGATRKSCAEAENAIETRFFEELAHVKKIGFWLTQMALTYETKGVWRTMLFTKAGS